VSVLSLRASLWWLGLTLKAAQAEASYPQATTRHEKQESVQASRFRGRGSFAPTPFICRPTFPSTSASPTKSWRLLGVTGRGLSSGGLMRRFWMFRGALRILGRRRRWLGGLSRKSSRRSVSRVRLGWVPTSSLPKSPAISKSPTA
jgi:hypothetical protein